MISDLLKRKIDVPKSIKDVCTTGKIIDKSIAHFEKTIIPYLNPTLSDDMYEQMRDMIMEDFIISLKKRNELLTLLEYGEKAEFLAKLFIYLIHRDNKNIKEDNDKPIAISEEIDDDIFLLFEVGFECPKCHVPLIEKIKDRNIKKYEIIQINLNNSENNKIALCKNHAEQYKINATEEDYIELQNLKTNSIKLYNLKRNISNFSLEEDIREVIIGLSKITDNTKLEELSLEALKIDQKIYNNYLLKQNEISNILRYYNYIDNIFKDMERLHTGSFDLIASEIKIAYKKLNKEALSQEEIINQLTEWIKNKSKVENRLSCHIVVSYFIQNCEVFDEISK